MSNATVPSYQVRWLIKRDMTEVMRIEQQSFEFAWTEQDFLTALRQRNCIGRVVEMNREIVGFVIYEMHKKSVDVINLAVDPQWRRMGLGRALLQRVDDLLHVSRHRRDCVQCVVRDSNLTSQLFLRSTGFKATQVLRGHYDETNDDGYLFRKEGQTPCVS